MTSKIKGIKFQKGKKGGTNKMCHSIKPKKNVYYFAVDISENKLIGQKALIFKKEGKKKISIYAKYMDSQYQLKKDMNENNYYITAPICRQHVSFICPARHFRSSLSSKKFVEFYTETTGEVNAGLHISPYTKDYNFANFAENFVRTTAELIKAVEQVIFTHKYLYLAMKFYVDDIVFFDGGDVSARKLYFLQENEFAEFLQIGRQKMSKSGISAPMNEKLAKKAEENYSAFLKILSKLYVEEENNNDEDNENNEDGEDEESGTSPANQD